MRYWVISLALLASFVLRLIAKFSRVHPVVEEQRWVRKELQQQGPHNQTSPHASSGAESLLHVRAGTQTDAPTPNVSQQCVLQRDATTNTFSLPGDWEDNSTLAALLDGQHQQFGCRGPLPYPYNNHGCCSSQPSTTGYLQSIFCPEISLSDRAIHFFLNVTRGKTVLFLGDSLTLQMYSTIEMQLRAHRIPYQSQQVENLKTRQIMVVPSTQTTIRLVEFYRLEDVNRTGTRAGPPKESANHVHDNVLRPAIQKSDFVFSNVGLHNWGDPEYHYRQYKHVQEMVVQENSNRNRLMDVKNNKTSAPICLLWRRTFPQHFASTNGDGQYGNRVPNHEVYGCQPLNQTWTHPSDKALARIQSEYAYATATIDLTSILYKASAFHSRGNGGGDCSHMCYSPVVWNPILYVTAETIRQAC